MSTIRSTAIGGAVVALVLSTVSPAVARDATAAGPAALHGRDLDPVVLTGNDLAPFLGAAPSELVGFRWDGGWDQVPVQVDERHREDLAVLRDGGGSTGVEVLAYSDPGANAGPDPDAAFDANDELVVLGGDTGPRAPLDTPEPAGTDPVSRLDVEVTDPTDPDSTSHVSLFRSGSLDPAAGEDHVSYAFTPLGGGDEDSSVQTDRYRTRFTARWTRDLVEVEAPFGTGVDVLDRHRTIFAPGVCGRSEDTFSGGPGGFATNVDGPIRAIRSYLGANSGTYTQREHQFFPAHEVTTSFLRVHAIPGVMDLWDHSPDATGMTYANDVDPDGVTIDGSFDEVGTGRLTWERIDGDQGGIVHVHDDETDIDSLAVTSYYEDDTTPPEVQCTGDDAEYGASGNWITSPIPNTDPVRDDQDTLNELTSTRTTHYLEAGTTAGAVDDVVDATEAPLAGEVETFFTDVPVTHAFFAEIGWVGAHDVVTGWPDGTFRSTHPTTRQAAMAFLWRLAGSPTGHPDPGFTDVGPDHPFGDAIAWAAHTGITTGYPDGSFGSLRPAKRQALMTWLWRLAGSPTGHPDPGFTDVGPDHPFGDAIAWAARHRHHHRLPRRQLRGGTDREPSGRRGVPHPHRPALTESPRAAR
ncbi:MAG: S-layer homology domain-containing protein [Acidimicrobiia bacterium]|nr:S-layer homology domain-containing protein [Acidimicrobiia bacterium]